MNRCHPQHRPGLSPSPDRTISPIRLSAIFAALVTLTAVVATVAPIQPASAAPPAGTIGGLIAWDGGFSSNAAALVDGVEGPGLSHRWANSGNEWNNNSYPMMAVIDLGATYTVTELYYYGGQIPFPTSARLDFEWSVDGVSFSPLVGATNPGYDAWSGPIAVADQETRYLRVSFASVAAHFNVAEIAVSGDLVDNPQNPAGVISPTAVDGANSVHAARMVDGTTGNDPSVSWQNPNPWNSANFPMTATFDLGGSYELSELRYFVGNIVSFGSESVTWEYSADASGSNFQSLVTVTGRHAWNAWHSEALAGQAAQRLRVRFDSLSAMFNISEVEVFGSPSGGGGGGGGGTGGGGTGGGAGGTGGGGGGGGSGSAVGPLQPEVPGPSIVRAFGFGSWPHYDLDQDCIDLHDRYWVRGPHADPALGADHPENRAYHTWHPAITDHPDVDDLRCDFHHEHGFGIQEIDQDMFDLFGGWPAFGYAAEVAVPDSDGRHEDHVGHKLTVAEFRAAIGNAAGSGQLYDAGFDCSWVSKIHQGSWSMDALKNHLHEYFLALRCNDGRDGNGTLNNTVGTEFSVKFLYTYGPPNGVNGAGCNSTHVVQNGDTANSVVAQYATSLDLLISVNPNLDLSNPNAPLAPGSVLEIPVDSSDLSDPAGNAVGTTINTSPLPNGKFNGREFKCISGVIWNPMESAQSADLWTQPINIERPNGGGDALFIQPYYIIKNPARMLKSTTEVVRTIDECYDGNDSLITAKAFCSGAPVTRPASWDDPGSPFNGTLRAINFKTAWLRNAGQPTSWCTDAFGRTVGNSLPCGSDQIEQYAAAFDNHWNDGSYRHVDQHGNLHQGVIQGSIRSRDPHGNVFQATEVSPGVHRAPGIGFEFIIDNRNPDDDYDGQPDGAVIRARN